MIRLSNGHSFEYMSASGALGYDGLGWPWEQPWRWVGLLNPTLFTSVTKTLTLRPTIGNLCWYNPFRSIRLIRGGVVNAVGLSNPGLEWWMQTIGHRVDSTRVPLIVSIQGTPEELSFMAVALNRFDLVGLEINASCPNTGMIAWPETENVLTGLAAVKARTRFPVILKLSTRHDVQTIVPAVEAQIDAFSINSVPWEQAFPAEQSPLYKLGGGGVSGRAAQPFTWDLVQKLVSLTTVPVIAPSIWEYDDLARVRQLGAQAVSFGSVFLRYPWRPTLFVRRDREVMK